jgi:hypothetical protein
MLAHIFFKFIAIVKLELSLHFEGENENETISGSIFVDKNSSRVRFFFTCFGMSQLYGN